MLHVEAITICEGALIDERYLLEEVLGEGGMGVVWAATDTETGEARALKFVRPDATLDARIQARLAREATALRTLDHPNIVKVFGLHELPDGSSFFVMERLRGEALRTHLRRVGSLPVGETIRIARALASSLACAHAAGVVHRDLKPENVFLTEDGGVKILDFGVAKASTNHVEPSLTSDGAMLGTLHYMAPEQVFGDNDLDGRADVWALGILVYECVSGTRPTDGGGAGQVLKAIMVRDFPPLAVVAPGCPPALSDVVQAMLSRERDARPAAREVDARLAEVTARASTAAVAPRRGRDLRLVISAAMALGGVVVYVVASRLSAPTVGAPSSPQARATERVVAPDTIATATPAPEEPPPELRPEPPPPLRRTTTARPPSARPAPAEPAAVATDPGASLRAPPPSGLLPAPSLSAAAPLATSRF